MGKIASAATVYAVAYLTEKGRTYLFNKNNVRFVGNVDLFEIKSFALGDPDNNYNTALRLISGDVPDVTGKSEGCLKATTDLVQSTVSYFSVDAIAFADPIYSTNAPGNILVVNTDITFPVNSPNDVPGGGSGSGSGSGSGLGSGVVVGEVVGVGGGLKFGA